MSQDQLDGDWRPIDTASRPNFGFGPHLILANKEKKWIRFGRWIAPPGTWYYSGTNERSQYNMMPHADDPTHWMPMPDLPK